MENAKRTIETVSQGKKIASFKQIDQHVLALQNLRDERKKLEKCYGDFDTILDQKYQKLQEALDRLKSLRKFSKKFEKKLKNAESSIKER